MVDERESLETFNAIWNVDIWRGNFAPGRNDISPHFWAEGVFQLDGDWEGTYFEAPLQSPQKERERERGERKREREREER